MKTPNRQRPDRVQANRTTAPPVGPTSIASVAPISAARRAASASPRRPGRVDAGSKPRPSSEMTRRTWLGPAARPIEIAVPPAWRDGGVDGDLGDPPGRSLDVARRAVRVDRADLEVDGRTAVRLDPLGEVLEGVHEPERLEDDRPAIGHQPLELEIHRPEVTGERVRVAAGLR